LFEHQMGLLVEHWVDRMGVMSHPQTLLGRPNLCQVVRWVGH
tara:strand:- start:72 stop:197 length:126 start_codon:yes stop_codon:yes gene_type:complete